MTATASGDRVTCAANSSGMDTGASIGSVSTARLPHWSNCSRSAWSRTLIADSRMAGSAVIAIRTRCSRSISTSIPAASNTSVRNSTKPPMPAGSPAALKRSASEKDRSIRAAPVLIGTWVTSRSPNLRPAAPGSLVSAGRFCQASMTCTSG